MPGVGRGLRFLEWVRQELDEAGRAEEPVLALGDGSHDNVEMWRRLPERVILVARTARNRRLPPCGTGWGNVADPRVSCAYRLR